MSVFKVPDLTDPKLRAKLAKGMGHNYYGEPAWPNDLLYIFPVVILGTLSFSLSDLYWSSKFLSSIIICFVIIFVVEFIIFGF